MEKLSDELRAIADVLDVEIETDYDARVAELRAATLRSAASALDASEKALRHFIPEVNCSECDRRAPWDNETARYTGPIVHHKNCPVREAEAALSALAPRAVGTRKTGDGA